MKLSIEEKNKKELFIALFHILKNCSSTLNINFEQERMHIQGMDKSHICLFDTSIHKNWFNSYELNDKTNIAFDSTIFYQIINTKNDGCNIIIHTESDDNLRIDFIASQNTKGEFNRFFKLPLIEFDYEELGIPTCDYDAEFTISSKKICETVSQLVVFGDDLRFICSEEKIDLITNGITGELLVNIPIDELAEFSIVEGENLDLTYSLLYINKMCLTNKLSTDVSFFISKEYPMKILYNLGDESNLVFFIAPKVND